MRDGQTFLLKIRLRRGGFTLIELLTVIAIIATMVSVVIGVASLVKGKSMVARTQASLEHMATELEEYKLIYGQYPDELTNIASKLPDSVKINRAGGPSNGKLRDLWNREYEYSAKNRSQSYELYSLGPLPDVAADNIHAGK